MSEMINSESKRLARMIQTFLDVERLAEGQMEMKRETFAAAELVTTLHADACGRWPSASGSGCRSTSPVDGTLTGDRELMEYAFYNLLTNAVKYSPPETHVAVRGRADGRENCGSPCGTREWAWTPRSSRTFSKSSTGPRGPRRRAKWERESACRSWNRSSRITAGAWK